MKKKRTALLNSILALLLCVAMLTGSTLAWFTDEVVSTGNIIQSGTLDVELEYWNGSDWATVKGATKLFGEDLWEPGYTEVLYLRVANKGNLALKWQLAINVLSEDTGTNKAGETFKLSDHIRMGVVADMQPEFADREAAVAAVKDSSGIIGTGYSGYGEMAVGAEMQYMAVVVYMPAEVDNVANHNGQDPASIDMGITLLATQKSAEMDSFGSDYDAAAKHPLGDINYSASEPVKAEEGKVAEAVTVGNATDEIYAEVPAGVKLADGAQELKLTVQAMDESKANITTTRDDLSASLNVHVEGVAADNTQPIKISLGAILPLNLTSNNVKLYHVENGVTVPMTLVADPVNHNEFSYNPATGEVVVAMQSFSEVAVVANTANVWDGTTVTAYTENGDNITIANAEQFVYFRNQVDAGNDFAGKTVTLTGDINLGGYNFDPIGWGYDNAAWNVGDATGKVFKGHFDGGNHTISGLYQNGWDLESSTGTDYTYTNCGGGLFASALDATFENLTIDGANIHFECVEIGVLVGLAQGNCTFNNINITGCKIANYQRPAGGVVGEVSPKVENGAAVASTHTFNNVYVDSNTVVGSMWGDFDAPVGGVIGAYWDDAGMTSVSMNNVTVACELDVYNDVTSTYQWYAYRRAGMLIGNTDEPGADGKNAKTATASFLTCNGCVVYYGDWADYHYCEFNAGNPNWPWVRVEPGENCEGYSNPRWGRPIDSTTGEPVTDSVHEHGDNEGHLVSIPFKQLYGGGQGVYGAETHTGVSEGIYTVTYMDHGEVLHVDYVTDNTVAYTAPVVTDIIPSAADGTVPSYWVDANGDKFTGLAAGRTANVIVYPKWPNEYTIRCLDTYGEVAYYNFVTDDNTTDAEYEAIAAEINNTLVNIQNEVDAEKKVMIIVWQNGDETLTTVTVDDIKKSVENGSDLILTATPQLQSTSITLEPVYDETTGELVAYQVTKVAQGDDNTSVVIPDYVGKIPVTTISNDAAAGFDNLHVVTIPATVTSIGSNSFASDWGIFDNGESITIYYEGSYNDWMNNVNKADGWADGLGGGSRIFFLNGTGKVDPNQGYLQAKLNTTWYGQSESIDWSKSTVTAAHKTEYTGECVCGCGIRPDAQYWTDVVIP